MYKKQYIGLYLFCILFCTSCTKPAAERTITEKIHIVSWNVETFFDAVKDGTEYKEFTSSSSKWNRDAYEARLDKLCEAVKKLDADVYVFEEIENDGVMYDISNRLAGNSWTPKKQWQYGCFAKKKGTATGCAVLSRLPLSSLSVHALDIRTENTTQPDMRPLMEVSLLVDGKPLILLINHWKAKSNKEKDTDVWRNWQESVLAGRFIYASGKTGTKTAVIACGDFNRDIFDFDWTETNDKNIILHHIGFETAEKIAVHTPWIQGNGRYGEPGSYYYNNTWERIDSFFAAGSASLSDFTVKTGAPWTNDNGTPAGYKVSTGTGCSDHLPISCSVTF